MLSSWLFTQFANFRGEKKEFIFHLCVQLKIEV